MNEFAAWHGAAGGLHAVMAIVVVIWFTANDTWGRGDAPLSRPTAKHDMKDGPVAYEPGVESIGTLPCVPLLLGVLVVTALAHGFYSMSAARGGAGLFSKWLRQGYNPGRYLEYGCSATVMVVIIAVLSGVRDASTLSLAAVCTVVTMLLGYMGDRAFATGTGSPWPAFMGGSALSLAVWGVIAYAFFALISDQEDAPDWLPALFWSQLALFAVFPIISSMRFAGKLSARGTEKAFIGASFTAKIVLAIILLSAFVMDPDDTTNNADTSTA